MDPRRPVRLYLVLPEWQKLRPKATVLLSKLHSVALLLGLQFWLWAEEITPYIIRN